MDVDVGVGVGIGVLFKVVSVSVLASVPVWAMARAPKMVREWAVAWVALSLEQAGGAPLAAV